MEKYTRNIEKYNVLYTNNIDYMPQEAKRVIDMDHNEARKFFLKNESYFNLKLPIYFNFSELLSNLSSSIGNLQTHRALFEPGCNPNTLEDVNYKIFTNKDGKYGWRKYQLIHPVLYIQLVHYITRQNNWNEIIRRIGEFSNDGSIQCISWPKDRLYQKTDAAENINTWLHDYEEESIELSLDFRYLLKTDITGCYGSIYTHSIPWALHGREVIKANRDNIDTYYGNEIDCILRAMSNGQTNGIPEGSVLMDFIAELLLGYIDLLLFDGIKNLKNSENKRENTNYKIIRYRDDYRIFVNDPEFGKEIVKILSTILADMGMKLNNEKTSTTDSIIIGSIKQDKIERFKNFAIYELLNHNKEKDKKEEEDENTTNGKTNENNKREEKYVRGLKKWLLLICKFSEENPNSGSVLALLNDLLKDIEDKKIKSYSDIRVLIAILIDIGFYSPRAYPLIFNILSRFLDCIEGDDDIIAILERIYDKLLRLPRSEYLDLWIQRLGYEMGGFPDDEKLCKQISNSNLSELWNSSWLKQQYKTIMDSGSIIDEEEKSKVTHVIPKEETDIFGEYPY